MDAINAQYGSFVTAAVVAGAGGAGDQRIQLTSVAAGDMTLDLQKASSLQTTKVAGELASYEVVNSGKTVTSNTRLVTIAQGVSLTLKEQTDTPADVTVTRSTTALNNALSSFAGTYNSTVDLLAAQHGKSAGSLQGQSVLSGLQHALSTIATYGSDGEISTLDSLGLKLEKDGHFTYNQWGLIGADLGSSTGVSAFLGSTTGSGFLKAASDALTGLEDPVRGLLRPPSRISLGSTPT